jgi:hypothetical protein
VEEQSALLDSSVFSELRVCVPIFVRASATRLLGVNRQVLGTSLDGSTDPLRNLCGNSNQLVVHITKVEEARIASY